MAWLNVTGIHSTWSAVKPSCSASAYATALSKPRPLLGSMFCHGSVISSPATGSLKYGGKVGLSVPTVRMPGALLAKLSVAQGSGVGSADAAWLAAVEGSAVALGDPAPVQAMRRAAMTKMAGKVRIPGMVRVTVRLPLASPRPGV